MIRLTLPLTAEQIENLHAGDSVLLSGTVHTARDAAHKRLVAMIEASQPLPFDIKNAAIYYAGPCPAKPGRVFGSCGPTTSGRMDAFAPLLFNLGLQCTIGKGPVGPDVAASIKKNHAVYFCATGGAGALISKCVQSAQVVAFEELGAEAINKLEVVDFPVIVGIDAHGNSIVK